MSEERRWGGARAYSGPPRQTFKLDKESAAMLRDLARLGASLEDAPDRQGEVQRSTAILQDLIRDAWSEAFKKETIMRDYYPTFQELKKDLSRLAADTEVWQLDSAAYVLGSADAVAEEHGDNARYAGTVAELREQEG